VAILEIAVGGNHVVANQLVQTVSKVVGEIP
jgi:hypothetical protein